MKTLFRILLILVGIAIIVFYSNQSIKESKLLKAPNSSGHVIPQKKPSEVSHETVPRPHEGLSVLIGKSSEEAVKQLGTPNRIDPSAYGYDWWVYNQDSTQYLMLGVENEKITQVYLTGKNVDAAPFQIGQSIDEIYRTTIIDTEITVNIDSNVYTFLLNEEDMKTRLLTMYDGMYAQLYIDEQDQTLEAVRFMDGKTLVLHQPYEMTYLGELITPQVPSSYLQASIDEANEKQFYDITNVYRETKGIKTLEDSSELSVVAKSHSEDMAIRNYVSHESPENGGLKDRLNEANIDFDRAGENIAANYYDSAEAVHGLLNSEDHRSILLGPDFSHLGSGVFGKYYTQIFTEQPSQENPTP